MNVKLMLKALLIFGMSTIAVCLSRPVNAEELDASKVEFFEAKVRPLLAAYCYECHSQEAAHADKLQGGLRLDNRAGVQQGGESGPIVVPGKPNESALISSVRYADKALQMPPKEPLSAEQVAILEKWVSMGAPDPREGTVTATPAKPGIDFTEGRKRWAFQPLVKHATPYVTNGRWTKQPLDYFVLAALEQRSLQPVRAATRQELIRRATFDLIGLPPTPEECAAFENDAAPGAWERVINRLLMSPHYGERWGRYWLDVARYADDQGNSFLTPTPAAYLYRDWVVRAFNDDMPYDEFVRLQIAGDELPGPASDYDPGNEYLWRMTPRRLDIEAWRDALLSVSGSLDPLIGGPSVDQTTPGLKEVEGFNFFSRLNGFEADNPAGRRRTLYTVVSRYAPNTTLTLFDFPEPNVTSDQRNVTTVPQQQLFVLNGPFMFEMSREFAKRLDTGASTDPDRIRLGWQLAYSRQPTAGELTVAMDFLQSSTESTTTDRLNHWEQLAHAVLASNEFMFLP